MYRITRIDAVSWAKTITIATLLVLTIPIILAAFVLLLGGLATAVTGGSGEANNLLLMAPISLTALGLLIPIGLLVFVVEIIRAVIINWALGRSGGLAVDLAQNEPPTARHPTTVVEAD